MILVVRSDKYYINEIVILLPGKRLCHIRKRVYAVYIHRSDVDDCVGEGHVWRQILYHNLYRNVFWAFVVALLQPHFDGLEKREEDIKTLVKFSRQKVIEL